MRLRPVICMVGVTREDGLRMLLRLVACAGARAASTTAPTKLHVDR
jgi:hypothetical protein